MTVEPIELFAPTRSSIIRLTLVDIGPAYYPGFWVAIGIENDGFTGQATFHIDMPIWKAFLTELLECERTRQGSATLDGIDHWDSSLILGSADSTGHFDIHYQVRRGENFLAGRFSLDMEFFGQMVSGFQRLDKAVSNNSR